MKNKIYGSTGILLFLAVIFFLMGCVSDPVKINWPENHPANPEIQETEFIRPQNPFESNMADKKDEPDKDPMIKHKMPKESGMQHMDHSKGTDKKEHSGSESKMKLEHTEGHTQHQEHSQ